MARRAEGPGDRRSLREDARGASRVRVRARRHVLRGSRIWGWEVLRRRPSFATRAFIIACASRRVHCSCARQVAMAGRGSRRPEVVVQSSLIRPSPVEATCVLALCARWPCRTCATCSIMACTSAGTLPVLDELPQASRSRFEQMRLAPPIVGSLLVASRVVLDASCVLAVVAIVLEVRRAALPLVLLGRRCWRAVRGRLPLVDVHPCIVCSWGRGRLRRRVTKR